MFDFSKIPVSEYPAILNATNNGDGERLKVIHDTYKVSQFEYCCDLTTLVLHFRANIEQFKTKKDDANSK